MSRIRSEGSRTPEECLGLSEGLVGVSGGHIAAAEAKPRLERQQMAMNSDTNAYRARPPAPLSAPLRLPSRVRTPARYLSKPWSYPATLLSVTAKYRVNAPDLLV